MRKTGNLLILFQPSNKNYHLFDDLETEANVILRCVYPIKKNYDSYFKSFMIRVVKKLSNYTKDIFPYLYFRTHNAKEIFKELPNITNILVVDGAINYIDIDILQLCKRLRPNITLDFFLINIINSDALMMKGVRNKMYKIDWNNIYTFDKGDAKKYGFKHLGFCYYSAPILENVPTPSNDIFLVATATHDRESMFHGIYKNLTKKGCLCDFHIKSYYQLEERLNGIDYMDGKTYTYLEILNMQQNSKCILEILRGEQTGPSLRYFEAVCYNKKLLTNNPEIIHFPYYNEKYMRVFNNIEKIDIDWIKEDINVDYKYKGDFSPREMIKHLS